MTIPSPPILVVQLEKRRIIAELLRTARSVVGREPGCDIVLPGLGVSRRHLEVTIEPHGIFITDLGSSHGTFIAGERLLPHTPHRMEPGERLSIADYELFFEGEFPALAPEQTSDVAVMADAPPARPPTGAAILARRSEPVTALAHSAPARYMKYLPGNFHDNDFLRRFLLIFEQIREPMEERLDHVHAYFDPLTCPLSFLRWIASWSPLPASAEWPEPVLRAVLAEALHLSRWRGTAYGLKRAIELCTGATVEIKNDAASEFVFRVKAVGAGDRTPLIEELVRMHKPAHCAYVLEVKP